MSDRANTITVALEDAMRLEDVEPILAAIRQMRGVIAASADIADHREWMAIERARAELGRKIMEVVYPNPCA